MFLVTLSYVYPLNHSLYRNYRDLLVAWCCICAIQFQTIFYYSSRLLQWSWTSDVPYTIIRTFPQITTLDFHKYMSSELYYIGSSAKEVPWCGAAPLLPPPPPSPPSSGLSVISPPRPSLVGCVRFSFRGFKLPGGCLPSWSPEESTAVCEG